MITVLRVLSHNHNIRTVRRLNSAIRLIHRQAPTFQHRDQTRSIVSTNSSESFSIAVVSATKKFFLLLHYSFNSSDGRPRHLFFTHWGSRVIVSQGADEVNSPKRLKAVNSHLLQNPYSTYDSFVLRNFCQAVHNGDVQWHGANACRRNHPFRSMPFRLTSQSSAKIIREGETVHPIGLCICLG